MDANITVHSPSARALRNLERYCIILVHTLKPATWAITTAAGDQKE